MATNSGSFSVAYADGSFSAQGSFSSSGLFGEMGTERNGSFVEHQEGDAQAELIPLEQGQTAVGNSPKLVWDSHRLKGRVPLRSLTP
jgi:hypothetical protein